MSEYLTPTSELEAVNAILASVGESPVDALDGEFVDAELARNMLTEESRRVQTAGWSFNEETDLDLVPTSTGIIYLPQNTLRFIYTDSTLTQRGNRVYDKVNHTYTGFTDTITATLIVALNFDELPEALRLFLLIRAGRRFQDRETGSPTLHQFQASDEISAWAAFLNYEAEVGVYNAIDGDALVQRIRSIRP